MNQYPMGLAALTASPYADSDIMNVRMTPREVAGLQQLAMSYGANERDLYDPVTGQPRFSFLKKILPMIAGAVLPNIGPIGRFAETIGFGSKALGTSILVGGVTGLIEGDLKKGLMAGLGAYSGAKIGEGLSASAEAASKVGGAAEAPKTESTVQTSAPVAPRFTEEGGTIPQVSAPPPPAPITPVQTVTKAPPTGFFGTMGQGISGLMKPEGRTAFMDALGGGLSKSAVFMGAMDALTPEQKPFPVGGAAGEDIVYIPGGFNPQYGTGIDQPYQLPGKYYKRTPQGLVPYNPFQLAPRPRGFATGGPVQAPDQNMNQQRAIPHQTPQYPFPNQNYPLSTVMQANYQSNSPQPREVLGGYEVAIDPYNGEERFAEGGIVPGGPETFTPINVSPYAESTTDPNVLATRAYIEELNRRARFPYGAQGTSGMQGGISGLGAAGTYQPIAGGTVGGGGGVSSGGGVGGIVGGIAANYLKDKFTTDPTIKRAQETQIRDPLEGTDLSTLPTTTAALAALSPFSIAAPRTAAIKLVDPETGRLIDPETGELGEQAAPVDALEGTDITGLPATQTALAALSPFNISAPSTPTIELIDPETGRFIDPETGELGKQASPIDAFEGTDITRLPATQAALAALSPFATATKTALPYIGEPVYDAAGEVTGFKYPDGKIESVEEIKKEAAQPDTDLQAKTQAPVTSILSAGTSGLAGLSGLGTATKTGLTSILPVGSEEVLASYVSPGSSAAANAAATGTSGTTAAGSEAAKTGLGKNAILPGLQTVLGAYETFKGIESGSESRAALGGFGLGAGLAGLGGAGVSSLGGLAALGATPVGLAAAAIAAIGASLVNTKEFGDVALRNYWNAVDQGRGFGQAPPEELAQGFINFYRTNKNDFAGQQAYGRTGNEDFVYDMTQVINNAVKSGKVNKDVDPTTMYKEVVEPWLNSMGSGPQNADAKRIQDFMMTDLIHNFMAGAPISNSQVKGDSKYKMVSERPVYAGMPPPVVQMYGQMPAGFQGRPRDIFATDNPFAALEDRAMLRELERESIMPVDDSRPFIPEIAPKLPGIDVQERESIMPTYDSRPSIPFAPPQLPGIDVQERESIMPTYDSRPSIPFAPPQLPGVNIYEDQERESIMPTGESVYLAEGGAIGDDYNFGFAGGGMPPMSEYRAGGKLLRGEGDGMSDDIPAVIRGRGVQRAALADGEFVIPADVVSHLGNGSTNAGAKKLHKMMAQIRQARTGRSRQAPAVKTDRYLPA